MVPEDSSPAGEVAERILEPCTLPLPLHRPRKRYVGVRQRPSGRWVAEIKDTTHKIRLWLGTFNNPEDAARAYDHAARTLRGANTRTNFASPAASRLSARLLDAGSLHAAAAAVQPGVNQILPEQREVSNPHAALMRPGPEQPSSFSSFPGALLAFQPAASMGAQQMSGAGSGYLTPGASEQACVGDNKSSSDDVVHGLDHSWLGNGLDARHTVTTANQQTPVLEAIRAVADWGNLGQEADRMVWQHPAPPSQQPPMEAVASINWGDQFGSFSRPQQVPDLCAPNYLQPVAGNDSSYDGELMWGSSAAACEYVQSPCVFTHTTCDPTSQFLPSHSHSEHADIGLNFLLSSSPGPFCTDSLPPPIFCDGIHTHAPVSHSAHHAAAAAEYDTFNRGTEGAGPPVSTPSSISASFPLGSSLDLSSSGSRQSAADPDPSLDADETSPTSFAPTPCLLGSTSSPACARGLADLDGEEEATFNPTPLAAQHLILSGVIRDAQALLSTCDSSQAMPVC